MKHKKDLEISELRKQPKPKLETNSNNSKINSKRPRRGATQPRSEKRHRTDAERSAKTDSNLDELKWRATTSQGHSKLDKERKKALFVFYENVLLLKSLEFPRRSRFSYGTVRFGT